jgi:hypothetical protein
MAFERLEPNVFASQDSFSMSFSSHSEEFLTLYSLVGFLVGQRDSEHVRARCKRIERKQLLDRHLADALAIFPSCSIITRILSSELARDLRRAG